jgi:ribonuclease P protein component
MPRGPRREGFSRRHRFSARGSFAAALRSSRKLRGTNVVVNVAPAPGAGSRLGIALTRKLVPLATQRNRLRRLVRDVFRRHEVKNRGLDCVVALRKPLAALQVAQLRAELRELFDQLTTR